MGTGFRLARVAGVDVYLDWSLIIIFALVTFSLGAGVFPLWHPGWSATTTWLTAIAAAILFFLSVLLHEMSHALVGRSQGIDVPRITLFVFGGMAHMRAEPQTWRGEFWMSIVGPITSLVLGIVFILLATLASGPIDVDPDNPQRALAMLSPLSTLLFWLGPINVILALFNLVPGFPLDGGRVLRAVLWGITGDLRRATRWAANGGQMFAWLLIIAGLSMMLGLSVPIFGTGVVSGLWLALIGWFLNNAAVMSYRQLLVRESLEQVPVSKLMLSSIRTVAPDLTVRALVDDYIMSSEQRAYPVVDGDRLVGLICLRDVHKVPREAWERTSVGDAMTGADRLAAVSPDDDGSEALNMLSEHRINQLPVIDHGTVRGLIRREDILRWLSLYGAPDLPDRQSGLQRGI
jgi:Zn-dependent protease